MKNENKEKIKKLNWLGFQKKERLERIQMLKENGFLSDEFEQILKKNENLPLETSNQMAENGIGTFALPFSIAPNFIVDGKDYAIPMVTEEPSVVAGCSYAAKIIGKSGGFTTEILNRKMIGQVALYEILDFDNAISIVLKNKNELLKIANEAYPSIVARGGGAIDIEVRNIDEFLVVYLFADVKEAMGANILNTMLEAIKTPLENITNGKSLMAILSNYATESLVKAKCEVNIKLLSSSMEKSIETAKKIELASKFAKLDVYRAATHNKGIFNGIDAVVIATGNDWRAIEAGGNAFAAKNGKYEGLTTWTFDESENKLKGELTLPMPIASVGGSIGLNPSVKAAFNILGNPNAKTLASIITSVGLAQNFAAIKALVTTGIQHGHMKLQARSLALLAGAKGKEIDIAVEKLLESGKSINLENVKEILEKIK
ncbi:hydroxymethylglutaryl-CoA reductase, degradative [Leptotrichia wadei]|uniref:hydroxymethylglutaryl-CoA reductase, degradative n=1 Tax=Leptotrichia wadei TaxID=157687 RepID=UPI00352F7570